MKAIEFELLPLNSISVSNKRILKLRYQTQTQSCKDNFDKGQSEGILNVAESRGLIVPTPSKSCSITEEPALF